MNDRCTFILHAHTRPAKSAEFEALFKRYVATSRAEEGCLEYHMLRDAHDPALFIFFEAWQSPKALAAHNALPHMRKFHEQRMDFLTRDFEVRPIEMLSASSAKR
ncbi:antibiotic biosynthesis monooxygenase [Stutzerimonas stutzeri]|uniref:Antibiotic biosynthesis monooxygenase n=1 Tax=Stutzerimonas stutzeri TaxID=316 RepID=W8R2F6_STUST|nr:putative quinol monooxygenase [Stutzerimonas stutzeri]AHL73693.1 antibiotic biosynthesis monooxygenase [Stutzerimonas stutzeri]MCQ4328792.1 antibiotic biosynthesis monooxygenase [Stutzerimonas stutzeri]